MIICWDLFLGFVAGILGHVFGTVLFYQRYLISD